MKNYDIIWTTQSKNSSESMPLSGKDSGANVWVEENRLYIYLQQGGWFDENNSLLKYGRIVIENQEFDSNSFKQILHLEEGYIEICVNNGNFYIWFDIELGTFQVDATFEFEEEFKVSFESWRDKDRYVESSSSELFQCKEVYQKPASKAHFISDKFIRDDNSIISYHKNENDKLSFDILVEDQGLNEIKDRLYNPQKDRIFGGKLRVENMVYDSSKQVKYLDTNATSYTFKSIKKSKSLSLSVALLLKVGVDKDLFFDELNSLSKKSLLNKKERFENSKLKRAEYYNKSYIEIDSPEESPLSRVSKNYQLFRYMLSSNLDGFWPTKFNGGLFTFDPSLNTIGVGDINEEFKFTPDYRRWGGAAHTIQNQRLVYWPMLKQGDFKTMKQQFDLMNRVLENAKLRTSYCFGCEGAVYPEQMSINGLCNNQDMGWGNTTGWPEKEHIRYHLSNSLEMILMILDYKDYSGESIEEYMDFIESILAFYNDFYDKNDSKGKMIIYPAGCMETYANVKNPIDSIAGLNSVLKRLLKLDDDYISRKQKEFFNSLFNRIPPYSYAIDEETGEKYLKYGESPGHLMNCENPETYVLFPYREIGNSKEDIKIGKKTIEKSIRTEAQNYYYSWHTLGVEYAQVNDFDKACERLILKMDDGPFRFPSFWGPGHDWSPDFNWGGSGMLQLQEMILREDDESIYVLPSWSKDIYIKYRLYCRDNLIINVNYNKEGLKIKTNKAITKKIIIPNYCKCEVN